MKDQENQRSKSEGFRFPGIIKDFKFLLFGVLNLLLKEDEISVYISGIISFVEVSQAFVFPFHPQVFFILKILNKYQKLVSVWNSDKITFYISQAVQYIGYVPKISWNIHLIIFYAFFSLTISLLLSMVYLSYTYSKKIGHFSGKLYVFKILMNLFSTILYLPILNIFLLTLDCTNDNENVLRHTYFSEVVCWQQTHILHSILSIFISIIFTLLVMVLSLTYFETKTITNDPNAK